jgi:hypothetical protein
MLDKIKVNLESSSDINDQARESSDLGIVRPLLAVKRFSMATADEGLPTRYKSDEAPKTRPLDTDHGNDFWSHFGTQNSPIEVPK